MDLSGRIILEVPSTSEKEIILNTANLPAGVYLIKLINKKEILTKKIIIKN